MTQQAYNWNPTALERLPKTIRDVLGRGDKDGKMLSPEQREAVADGLLRCGIQKGENVGWMCKLIRHKLGVGNYPVPPSKLAEGRVAYQLAQDRAKEIIDAVLDLGGAWPCPLTPQIARSFFDSATRSAICCGRSLSTSTAGRTARTSPERCGGCRPLERSSAVGS